MYVHVGWTYLREAGEAEEDVDDVGGEFSGLAPILAQHARQSPQQSLVLGQFLQIVRSPRQLQDQRRSCRQSRTDLMKFVRHFARVFMCKYKESKRQKDKSKPLTFSGSPS